MRELLKLLHALPEDHPVRPTVSDAVIRGLNQAATETLANGYTGAWTDNFARGLQWIGENQEWRSALNINLNASGQIVAPFIGLAAVSVIEAVQ